MKKTYITFASYLLFVLTIALFVNEYHILTYISAGGSIALLATSLLSHSDRFHFTLWDMTFLVIQLFVYTFFKQSLLSVGLGMYVLAFIAIIYNSIFMANLRCLPKDSRNFFIRSNGMIITVCLSAIAVICFFIDTRMHLSISTLVNYSTILVILYLPFVYSVTRSIISSLQGSLAIS